MLRHTASRTANGLLPARLNKTGNSTPLQRNSTRPIVSMPTLKALKRMPWFPVAFSNFRFQASGGCVDNAESTQEHMIRYLYRRNQIEVDLPEPEGMLAKQLQRVQQTTGLGKPAYEPKMETLLDPTAQDIAHLAREHGPVAITMAVTLGRNQGADQYVSHHAMVVLCTFKHEGRIVAVVLDGNDLQSSPVMDKVHVYAKQHGIPLEGLTPLDLMNIQSELGSDADVAQLPFRLIDLDTVVSASRAKQKAFEDHQNQIDVPGSLGEPTAVTWPNSARWAVDASVKVEPLPPDALNELEALCHKSPELIELLDTTQTSSRYLDE